jgi:cytochrome c
VTGREGPNDVLVGGAGTLTSARPVRTVGSYWPYATTLWDYINRAMPFAQPRTLTANEVYAVTAFLLQLNGIDVPGGVLDERTLPQVRMPNRDGFIPDQRRK